MYLYPKWIRFWHLFNAILLIVLIITGLSMLQYTDKNNPGYVIGFAKAVRIHNFTALLMIINYIVFVTGNFLTTNGKHYRLEKKNFFSSLGKQMKYYVWGMYKGEKQPFPVTEESKFNPFQKLSYILAMYVAIPLLIISGIGLLIPEITINSFLGISGLILTDILHITMGFFLLIFLIIHIYICVLGAKSGSHLWSIISGYRRSD